MSSTFTDRYPDCPCCDGPSLFVFTLGTLDIWICMSCDLQFDTPANDDQDGDYPDW